MLSLSNGTSWISNLCPSLVLIKELFHLAWLARGFLYP
jgi:hypothetical protein